MTRELYITIPCEPAKPWTENDVRPLHIFFGFDSTGAAKTGWECPFCGQQMPRRKPLEKHMGMVMNVPAGCKGLVNRQREDFVRTYFSKIKKERENGTKTDERCAMGRSAMCSEGERTAGFDVYASGPRPNNPRDDLLLDNAQHLNLPRKETQRSVGQSNSNENVAEAEARGLSDALWMIREREKVNWQT